MTQQTNNKNRSDDQIITLRCSKCGKRITPSEAIQTPTGYRCEDCVRNQQKVFDSSQPLDFVWGFLIAAILSLIGSFLTSVIGFFTFLMAPAAGMVIAEAVRLAIKKRRSKRVFRFVVAGVILGGLPMLLISGLGFLGGIASGSFRLLSLLPPGYQILYLVMAVPSTYYRLSGNRRL